MSVRIPLFSCSVRSTSFHLHRRLSRRRLPPAGMAKKKPLKKLPHRRSPTGKDQTSANLSISTPKSTPKVPLAVQKQSSTSTPATVEKELAIPDAHTASYEPAMAIQTDSPKSETLATVTKYVPSCPKEKTPEGIAAASTTTPNHTATSADIWKGFIARGRAEVARGKQHVKSLLPTVTKTKAVYVPVNSTETPPQDRRHPISPSGRKLSSLSIMEDTVDNLALTFGSPPAKTALETETIGRFNEHCKFRKQLCLRY
ncbi:hypothetical protein F2Q69_00058235 [Brassica cretica]|uniref:Uncharacterized protein n=1 Tax=Brassica cretica TaxID=69181 RepID=A0A8S9RHY1_BRACR|nr:hypothetical protein F2Q69_00058235 [Brassica cretica]